MTFLLPNWRLLIGLGVAAVSLAIPAVVFAATPQQPQAFGDLFDLAQHDYSMAALEQIFGGIIDFIRTGQTTNLGQETLLTTPFMFLNIFAFGIAAVVALYTLADYVISSAATGTPGGGISTPYTLLRFGAGAVLLIPVQGGFAIIHLVAFWIMMQGAGLADTAWERYADTVLSGAGTPAGSSDIPTETWPLREGIAAATYALTAGHLCRLHMDRLSDIYDATPSTMSLTSVATDVQAPPQSTVGFWRNPFSILPGVPPVADSFAVPPAGTDITRRLTMYFQSPATAGDSRAVCPYLSYEIAGFSDTAYQARASASLQERLNLVAAHSVFAAVEAMMSTVISPRASALAQRIYSGAPPASSTPAATPPAAPLRSEQALFTEVEAIVAAGEAAMAQGVATARAFSTPDVLAIRQSIINDAVDRGWALAPLHLRSLGQVYLARRALLESIRVTAVHAHDIGRVYGRSGRALSTASSVDRASFAPVERDYDFLQRVVPRLSDIAAPYASSAEVDIGGKDGSIEWAVGNVVNALTATGGGGYSDPFAAYMVIGTNLTKTAAVALGAGATLGTGAAAAGFGKFVPIASAAVWAAEKASAGAVAVGSVLVTAGLVFSVVVPFLPILFGLAAFIGWLLTCIEVAFALPLIVLSWFSPGREHSLRGTLAPLAMPLFRVLLTPFFIFLGLVICCLLLWLGGQVLAIVFGNALGHLAMGGAFEKLVVAVGTIGLYVVAMVLLALYSARIIIEFDDRVLALIANAFGVSAGPSSSSASSGMFDTVSGAVGGGVVAGGGRLLSGAGQGTARGARQAGANTANAVKKQMNIKKLAGK